jgi:hypothetical protein
MIFTFDNTVPFEQMQFIYNFVSRSYFRLGWEDRHDIKTPNIHSRYTEEEVKSCGLYPYIKKIIDENNYGNNKFVECIVNLSKSGDYNFCHTHKDKIVLLYYVNLNWQDGFGGETIFYDDDLINAKSVSSFVPGRIILFDGAIPHTIRAQSTYGPDYRFTISYFLEK